MKLRLLVLIMFAAAPVLSHAQSLGEVAREVRTERRQSDAHASHVYTNEDFAAPALQKPAVPTEDEAVKSSDETPVKDDPAKDAAGKSAGDVAAKDGSAKDDADKTVNGDPAKSAKPKLPEKAPKTAAEEHSDRERESQRRSDEINRQYIDRINAIHQKISDAQELLTKLQVDQLESSNQFRRSVGTSPSIPQYEADQREYIDKIAAQKTLLDTLHDQLEDAREAARHAGVPHALDY